MEDYMRKLALWHTKTFKPIMTHEELEPIMAKLGFVGLPVITSSAPSPPIAATSVSPSSGYKDNNSWKEYYFTAGGSKIPWVTEPLPRPKLPYPRIDGLHHKTYGAFCDAVAFYIDKSNLADHFHVRGMPLHRVHDRPFNKKFRLISEDEVLYVYREGTLDPATAATIIPPCNSNINNINVGNSNSSSTMDHRLVLLKDINHNIEKYDISRVEKIYDASRNMKYQMVDEESVIEIHELHKIIHESLTKGLKKKLEKKRVLSTPPNAFVQPIQDTP